jgi:putative drug exporter of the RND superfamily
LPSNVTSSIGARALEKHFPPGLLGLVTVLLRSDQVDFDSDKGIGLVQELTDQLQANKNALGIADLRSVAKPLGTGEAAKEALASLPLPAPAAEAIIRNRAVNYYVSHTPEWKGHVTRIDLVLGVSPLSLEGIAKLDQIEQFLETEVPEKLRLGSEISICGPAATIRDLRTVTRNDQTRVQILVPIAVFVLLLIVFRQAAVSLYLIVSVLFSFFATLRATFIVFWLAEGEDFAGLDWTVPLFLFTILVAVGEDYNIFLLRAYPKNPSGL